MCIGTAIRNRFIITGVGVHSITKTYSEKYENISLNIYMIFYFETVE